jgi:2-dehydro-3-deoxyphosphogluconate aldolase / (4S)-4-hydroxy-2-oxoglutarate aldolase
MTQYPVAALIAPHAKLIPVLHVENADHAEPLFEALVTAGIKILEVTLRSAAGPEVIRRMRKMNTDAIIGAGTVTKADQLKPIVEAGAMFGVSPALTPALAEQIRLSDLPFLPGICTPSESLYARECGFFEQKFFPADLFGGMGFIQHVDPLFPDVRFCPTGGISDENSSQYLALRNIFAVGGAFLAPRDLIEKADWKAIHERGKASVAAASR